MTTVSLCFGSLFWGGKTSSCNDDPMPADRTPLVEASDATGAPSWSPMIGSRHAAGRIGPSAAPLVACLVGAAAGLAMLLGPASGTDLSAQQARAAFAAAHPGAAVDLRWYAGVFPAAYSVTAPYVEAVVGARPTGILAAGLPPPPLPPLLGGRGGPPPRPA